MINDMTLCANMPKDEKLCETCLRNIEVTIPNEYHQSWCNFKIVDNECNGYLEVNQ